MAAWEQSGSSWIFTDNSGNRVRDSWRQSGNDWSAYLESNAATLTDATTRINGDRYFFDAYGRMRSGLLGFTYPDGSVISAYFGANDSDGRMKTGRRYLVNESGRIQDSNRFYRVYGEYRYEYNNGTIYYVNNQRERHGEVTHSERLPGIAFDAVYTLRPAAQ